MELVGRGRRKSIRNEEVRDEKLRSRKTSLWQAEKNGRINGNNDSDKSDGEYKPQRRGRLPGKVSGTIKKKVIQKNSQKLII